MNTTTWRANRSRRRLLCYAGFGVLVVVAVSLSSGDEAGRLEAGADVAPPGVTEDSQREER